MRKTVFKVVVRGIRISAALGPYNKASLSYKKGDTVSAIKNSIGIFVFKTKKQAVNAIDNTEGWSKERHTILRCKPIGNGRKPKPSERVVASNVVVLLFHHVPLYRLAINLEWPDGTMVYPAVEVLD